MTGRGDGASGFSPDGRWLLTTGGGCRLWEVETWRPGPVLGGGMAFAFAPDGVLAVESGQGAVRLVDPGTGRDLARLSDPQQAVAMCLAFSPDGSRLVATSRAGAHVWDLRLIRERLGALGLDWDRPPYPPAGPELAGPERLEVRGPGRKPDPAAPPSLREPRP